MSSKPALLGGPPVRIRPFNQWPIIDHSDEDGLLSVLSSGKWGRHLGDRVLEFERVFAEYSRTKHCIAMVNGSVALRLSLMAAGIEAGDEVIIPPYTFFATASSVVEVNGLPIFVDIEPDTFNLDPEKIEAAVTPRTRAIIPVHFGGLAADMDRIMTVARRHNLLVIEDAAQAHGSDYHGKRLGTIGNLGCFSFQASKNLNAGEGGAVLTTEDQLEQMVRSLHTCGRYPGQGWYDHYLMGGNYRMSEFHGALLLSQLSKLDAQVSLRDANGIYLNQKLGQIPGIHPQHRCCQNIRNGQYLYIFRYDASQFHGLKKSRFLEALTAEGIPCSPGYAKPLYRQPVFENLAFGPFIGHQKYHKSFSYKDINLPAAEQACQEAVWLAQPLLLGDRRDMDDICDAVAKIRENSQILL